MRFANTTRVSAGRICAEASATWALAVFCITADTPFGSYVANAEDKKEVKSTDSHDQGAVTRSYHAPWRDGSPWEQTLRVLQKGFSSSKLGLTKLDSYTAKTNTLLPQKQDLWKDVVFCCFEFCSRTDTHTHRCKNCPSSRNGVFVALEPNTNQTLQSTTLTSRDLLCSFTCVLFPAPLNSHPFHQLPSLSDIIRPYLFLFLLLINVTVWIGTFCIDTFSSWMLGRHQTKWLGHLQKYNSWRSTTKQNFSVQILFFEISQTQRRRAFHRKIWMIWIWQNSCLLGICVLLPIQKCSQIWRNYNKIIIMRVLHMLNKAFVNFSNFIPWKLCWFWVCSRANYDFWYICREKSLQLQFSFGWWGSLRLGFNLQETIVSSATSDPREGVCLA